MHAGRKFTLREVLYWTRKDILIFLIIGAVPTVIYEVLGIKWIVMPWLPIALVGTAIAFLIGFKNSASYDRLWEARKIWGGIVNSSRTWGIMSKNYVNNLHATVPASESELKAIHQRLIYRHFAWLTALRYQLRKLKAWEKTEAGNENNHDMYKVAEWNNDLASELAPLLSQQELDYAMAKKNQATQLIGLQSDDLEKLRESGLIDDFRHMEMGKLLQEFYTLQGQSERIKNFPYPRQFATVNLYFVWIFIFLAPFGMLPAFHDMGEGLGGLGPYSTWFTIPFSALVSWIFNTMERIGTATENPFEGGPSDVPITALSRTIEIDLREMLGETELPAPLQPENHILM
jgi:putative membrane protein